MRQSIAVMQLRSLLLTAAIIVDRTVTAEAAGSSPVVPAIHYKAVSEW